jgi:hypothetical protein
LIICSGDAGLALCGGIKQFRALGSDPLFRISTECGSEFEHLVRFFIGHGPDNIAAANVALLAKSVKSVNEISARRYREL